MFLCGIGFRSVCGMLHSLLQSNSLIPVSVLVVVKNGAATLDATLASLNGFSEVLVIDSHSKDGTVDIAGSHKFPVLQFEWNGHYPKKRQWVLDNITFKNEWIFFVDADEVVTEELKQEIVKAIKT